MYHIRGASASDPDNFEGGPADEALAGGNSLANTGHAAPFGPLPPLLEEDPATAMEFSLTQICMQLGLESIPSMGDWLISRPRGSSVTNDGRSLPGPPQFFIFADGKIDQGPIMAANSVLAL